MATAIMLGLSAASLASQSAQASLEEGQAEVQAKNEELRVKQREADRKDRLASALATQNAMAGAKGVAAFEGSPLTILQDSMERERVATERDVFSTELSNLALRSGARTRRKMSDMSARLGFFQSGMTAAQIG